MQEEFLTSVAQIKRKLRLDMDSASVRLTVWLSGGRIGETRQAAEPRFRAHALGRAQPRPSAGAGVRQRPIFATI
jgi:hypothetical protein